VGSAAGAAVGSAAGAAVGSAADAAVGSAAAGAVVGCAAGVAVPPQATKMGTMRTSKSASATLRRQVIRDLCIPFSFHNHQESVVASPEASDFL